MGSKQFSIKIMKKIGHCRGGMSITNYRIERRAIRKGNSTGKSGGRVREGSSSVINRVSSIPQGSSSREGRRVQSREQFRADVPSIVEGDQVRVGRHWQERQEKGARAEKGGKAGKLGSDARQGPHCKGGQRLESDQQKPKINSIDYFLLE